MRKLSFLFALCIAGLLVACGGDGDKDASSSPTARASAEASVTRTAATTTATTVAPTATPEPPTATPEPPTPEPPTPVPPTEPPAPVVQPTTAPPPVQSGPVTRTITAQGLAFSPSAVSVPSGVSVTIVLNNQDNAVPHDISIGNIAFVPQCTGPCSSSVTFTAPAPGSYTFICTVHPTLMSGTLNVTP